MKEKEATCFVSISLCVTVALLRMLAPQLPFDWMSLLLILFAACFPIILYISKTPCEAAQNDTKDMENSNAPISIPEMDALHPLIAARCWKRSEGDLPEALSTLYSESPFAAMCAARGVLAMLMKQSAPKEAADTVITLLTTALDAAAGAGEARVDRQTIDTLFAYALQAMGQFKI